MTFITSSPELRKRLTGRDPMWGQILVVRAALRVLPFSFFARVSDKWTRGYAITIFRSALIGWAAKNFSAHNFKFAAEQAHIFALLAYKGARSEAKNAAATDADPPFALSAGLRVIFGYSLSVAVKGVAFAVARSSAAWRSLSVDFEELELLDDMDLAAPVSESRLINRKLWPEKPAKNWADIWGNATTRLLTLDPTYQVWIDWYNRRIEGHAAAFDIPGDTDRTEDKKILARLADATDGDFWNKGATYVNTTLQRWIDEARERVALPNFDVFSARASAGVMPDFGTDEAVDRRADLEQKIAALNDELARLEPAPAPIGHNRPPLDLDDVEIDDIPAIVQEVRVQTAVLADEIKPSQPDLQKTLETVSRLRAIGGWLAKKADLFVDKAVEKAGELTGTGIVAVLLLQLPQIQSALVAVLKSAEKWLQAGLSML